MSIFSEQAIADLVGKTIVRVSDAAIHLSDGTAIYLSEDEVDSLNSRSVVKEVEINVFLNVFGKEEENGQDVDLLMDDHKFIIYNGIGYYVAENSILYTSRDYEILEFLVENYSK